LTGLHYLRSLSSARQLQAAYAGANTAIIIGAGFIGMEVAATLTQRGVSCTVVEMAPRIWTALVPEVTASFIQRHFEARGVRFLFSTGVDALEGDGRVRSVVLSNGTSIPADLVVAGVGAALNAGHLHLEHWDNALAQGRAVGKTLAGQPEPFRHVAYFFSDLFDLSLNMVGYPAGWDDIEVRGDPEAGTFTTVYTQRGKVRAALMVNDDADFNHWTTRVAAGTSIEDVKSPSHLALA
jgi:3-phenylpropionate/trans-cinnamate dioxygenase ferredoxin reductase subunit